jgi:YD repeat-containing protein
VVRFGGEVASCEIDSIESSVPLTYDSAFRVVAITDAIAQVTTLDYLDSAHPLRVTEVTDPFSRFATLTYDAGGRVATITDAVGIGFDPIRWSRFERWIRCPEWRKIP